MTWPGGIQAGLSAAVSVWAYNLYFERWTNVIAPVLLGIGVFAGGIAIQMFMPLGHETIYNLVTFNAKGLHQGVVATALGLGIIVGSLVAWVVSWFK